MKLRIVLLFLVFCTAFVPANMQAMQPSTSRNGKGVVTACGYCCSTITLCIMGAVNDLVWSVLPTDDEITDSCAALKFDAHNNDTRSQNKYLFACANDDGVRAIRPNFDAAFTNYYCALGLPVAYVMGFCLYKGCRIIKSKVRNALRNS